VLRPTPPRCKGGLPVGPWGIAHSQVLTDKIRYLILSYLILGADRDPSQEVTAAMVRGSLTTRSPALPKTVPRSCNTINRQGPAVESDGQRSDKDKLSYLMVNPDKR
jgi:hypothetical protein